MHADLPPLLDLLAADLKRLATEKEIKALPEDAARVEALVQKEHDAIESAKRRVRELELKSKQVEGSIRTAEERATKLRQQQVQVKKNDEYQALTREIADAEAEAGRHEEAEIAILYELDDARAASAREEGVIRARIREHEERLARIHERLARLRAQQVGETEAVAARRAAVSATALALYDRLAKAQRHPCAVPLDHQTCRGCHMRVSNEVAEEVRKAQRIVTCEHCNRILFLPP